MKICDCQEDCLEFERLNAENLKTAGKIQFEIFRKIGLCGYCDYVDEVEGKTNLSENYLIKLNSQPVGIVGVYEFERYPDDIFLDWLGVLPQFQRRGIATKTLLFALETAKKKGKKWLRLYTFPKEINGGGTRLGCIASLPHLRKNTQTEKTKLPCKSLKLKFSLST